jgi:hypothetical protein
VLRLKFVGGVPTREIARRIEVAASTVRTTISRFQAAGLSWPLPDELTDGFFRVWEKPTGRRLAREKNGASCSDFPHVGEFAAE